MERVERWLHFSQRDGLRWTRMDYVFTLCLTRERSTVHSGVRRPSPLFIRLSPRLGADPRLTRSFGQLCPLGGEWSLCRRGGGAEGAMSSTPVGNALMKRRPTSLPPPEKASELILRETASAPAAAGAVAAEERPAAAATYSRSSSSSEERRQRWRQRQRSHRRHRRRPPSRNDSRDTESRTNEISTYFSTQGCLVEVLSSMTP